MRQVAQITRSLVGIPAVEHKLERIALPPQISGSERLGKMRLLLPDASFGSGCLLSQVFQFCLGALAFTIQLTQLAYRAADGALRLTQLIRRFAAIRLGIVELLLQGLQALLEGIELGLLAIGLVGADAQGGAQHQ